MEVRQLSDAIIVVDRENCPFASHLLYDDMGKHEVKGEFYTHFEVEHEPFRFEVNATPTNPTVDTTIGVTGGSTWFVGGERLLASDGVNIETIHVQAVPADDDTVLVTRSTGGSTGASLAIGMELIKLGNAHEEYSKAPAGRMTKEVSTDWYLSIDRKSVEISKPAAHRQVIGGDLRTRQRALRTDEFKRGMELSLLLGYGALNIFTGTHNTRTGASKSVLQHISSFSHDMPAISLGEIEKGLEGPARRHGAQQGWDFLCSPRLYGGIMNLYRDRLETSDFQDRYGTKLKVLETQHGPLHLVRESMLAFGGLQEIGIAHPRPITSYSGVLRWNFDGMGLDAHWVLDILKDDNPTVYKDEILGSYGYWGREEGRFALFTGIQR